MFDDVIAQSKASIEKTDLAVLLPILASVQPQHVLEIGAWKGYSAEVWYRAFPLLDQLVTIERDAEHFPYAYQPNNLFYLHGDSHSPEIFTAVEKMCDYDKVDFLFIDGDHSFEGVKKDYQMYGKFVRKAGIIAFHDACYYYPDTEEVPQLWQTLKADFPYVEIKTGKASTGIGVIWKE